MLVLPSLRRRLHRMVVGLGNLSLLPPEPRRRRTRRLSSGTANTRMPPLRAVTEPVVPVSCLPIRLHCEHGHRVPLLMELRYDRADPFAMLLAFHGPADWTARWRLSRDVLLAGTHESTGHGTVRAWPSEDTSGNDVLFLRLGTDELHALVEVRRAPLRHWLAHTFTLVPAGREMAGVDWAEEMRLLAGGGGPGPS